MFFTSFLKSYQLRTRYEVKRRTKDFVKVLVMLVRVFGSMAGFVYLAWGHGATASGYLKGRHLPGHPQLRPLVWHSSVATFGNWRTPLSVGAPLANVWLLLPGHRSENRGLIDRGRRCCPAASVGVHKKATTLHCSRRLQCQSSVGEVWLYKSISKPSPPPHPSL